MLATITSVDTPIAPGTNVGVGTVIPIQVTFDMPVDVTGVPYALVNVLKSPAFPAQAPWFGSTAGGLIHTFNYNVQAGDTGINFDVLTTTQFLFPGSGTLTDRNSPATPVDKTVTNTSLDPTIATLKPGITVNGVAPPIPTVGPTLFVNPTAWATAPTSTPGLLSPDYFVLKGTIGATRALQAGEVLTVSLNGATYRATTASPPSGFSVDATGNWSIRLQTVGALAADTPFSGALQPWSTTNGNAYQVVATLTNSAGNSSVDVNTSEVVIDMLAPTVAQVTSTTPNGSYSVGDFRLTPAGTIDISVRYTEAVRVVGTPTILTNITTTGVAGNRAATFSSIDSLDPRIVHFQYVIGPGDTTPAGGLDYLNTTAIVVGAGLIQDQAGNVAVDTLLAPPGGPAPAQLSIVGSGKAIFIDTIAPTVAAAGVTSTVAGTPPTGTFYFGGPVIPMTVTFSDPVFVTGAPRLLLSTGTFATYAAGSGTTILTFNYTVAAGDDTGAPWTPGGGADLDYASATALGLNGGTIVDAANNNAVLTLAGPGAPGSLAANTNIVVAAAPTVLQVSSPTPTGTYTTGQTVRVWVMFSKPVTVVAGPAPTLQLQLSPISAIATASFNGNYITPGGATTATPTNIMQFEYVVQPGDSTAGQPINYVQYSLNAGAGIRFTWTAPASPGYLNADLSTLPLPTDTLRNTLPSNNIIVSGTATAAAPVILLNDTTNAIGQSPTDGITNSSTAAVNVLNLLTTANATWQYRYRQGGTAGDPWTSWLSGTGTAFGLPAGTYAPGTIEVTQTPWGGIASAAATNVATWTVDLTPPPPPSASITTTSSGTTNIPTVNLSGLEPNALVQYTLTYSSITNTSGTPGPYSLGQGFSGGTSTVTIPQGTYNPTAGTGVAVRQQDLAGNWSPWAMVIPTNGGPGFTITLDTTIATPTVALVQDTTPGFSPYTGVPYTTDNYTSNGLVNVTGLEVANLAATPPVTGIANWQYSTDSGGTWTVGGTSAPAEQFTLLNGSGLPGGTAYAPGQIRVRQTDLAGNVSTAWQNTGVWTIDQTAPTVQSASAASGNYTAGQTVLITVNFGEPIYLSATTPTLTLDTGATATLVTPVTPGASTLTFRYVVGPGETSSALTVTAFNLGTAVLADKAGNQAVVPLAAPILIPGTVVINAAIRATFSVGSPTASGPLLGAAATSIRIVFNTPVTNFTLASLRLYWNTSRTGTPTRLASLGSGAGLTQVNSTTYTLTLPKNVTNAAGAYMLVIDGTLTGIRSAINPSAVMTTQSRTYFRR